ncbi:hypothetical protein Ga0100231_023605 [Opitutaceae bacterium TAV4]|uniref:hypothetical protein n=1 Tax=Geminisphaera colitermitum TaxID=1148786 RepID=UPI00069403D4|nr:hypothetical protein [Geminisphaera colitermitum]RRJ96763.1 hypothetical protein Ga0100231_023605 [Opitutaceae bacterium TAV4]
MKTVSSHQQPGRSFRELYCEQRGISERVFVEVVFKKSSYVMARVLYPLIVRMQPDFFRVDIDLVASAGELRSMRGYGMVMMRYNYLSPEDGFGREWLRLRISRGRLRELLQQTFEMERSREARIQALLGAGEKIATPCEIQLP